MGIRDWFFKRSGETEYQKVSCQDLFDEAQEYTIRRLAFMTCVNMIASAISKCEFRTFVEGRETQGAEYYLWNVEPNPNQNSTAFLNKLITMLYTKNEALVIEISQGGGKYLVVADDWVTLDKKATKQREYSNVVVDDTTFAKTFREREVLHFTLNHCNVKPVLDSLYQSYNKLIAAAMSNYAWVNGQHWKVHVDQIAQGKDGWEADFARMINDQMRPFLNATAAVLPEVNGYTYERIDSSQSKSRTAGENREVKNMIDDIFDFTAKALCMPPVLINGDVAGTQDALNRWLTIGIDPLVDNLQEEINRKRFGFEGWSRGDRIMIDASTLIHFDLFHNAANIEKLIGSGYSFNDIQRAAGRLEIHEPWANEHHITKNFASTLKGGESE